MKLKHGLTSLMMTTALSGATMVAAAAGEVEEAILGGKLTVAGRQAYLFYFGETSGDTMAWYFDTGSPVGRRILAVCKQGQDCFVTGRTRIEARVPGTIPETTSGRARLISVSRVTRQPPD